jgi:hypothetical protein
MTIEESIASAIAAEVRPVLEELRAIRAALKREPATATTETLALLTVEDVAERCGGKTPETVRAWIHAKKLAARKVEGRYLVKPSDLATFLAIDATVENPKPIDSDAHLQLVMSRVYRAGSK